MGEGIRNVREEDHEPDQGSLDHAKHSESHVHRRACGRSAVDAARITSAEEHAQKEGWAPGEASKIRQSYYMAYLAQRYAGNTTMPYAQWLEEVDDIDVETPTAENPTV